jgi:cysteinyl-tRNA synthetase
VIVVHDTRANSLQPLVANDSSEVRLYVCGPTVQDRAHLGHGRTYVTFDLLVRHLEQRGHRVRYISNITDIDDKILRRAEEEGVSAGEVARRYEALWWEAMDGLGLRRPDVAPRATEWVPQMIALIEQLLATGAAYRTSDGVYLEVAKVPSYGSLTRQRLEDLEPGARVEANPEKRSPLDFALWKLAPRGAVGFEAPFGYGRPGWHTECVVMSTSLLGERFDLHGGGMDLAFPHHENELAQAQVLGMPFARRWMHVGFVELEGEKMSKSVGNVIVLGDWLRAYGARTLRFAYLRAHYRSPLELSPEGMADAAGALRRIDNVVARAGAELSEGVVPAEFLAALDTDLDTPSALAILFEAARQANQAFDRGQLELGAKLAAEVRAMADWLGVGPAREAAKVSEEVARLVARRESAKAMRDFAEADRLREEVHALGFEILDTREGPLVRPATAREG